MRESEEAKDVKQTSSLVSKLGGGLWPGWGWKAVCREKSGRDAEKRRGRWGIYTIRQAVQLWLIGQVAGLCAALEN